MAAIETLIKMKKQAKTDDLIAILDEVIAYGKLSKIEAFKDLTKSDAAAKKLPLLSAAHRGDIYAQVMLDVVRNIIMYMTGSAPEITRLPEKKLTKREEAMKDIMQKSVIRVYYHDLVEYDHAQMEESVVAVFQETRGKKDTALIVVRNCDVYDIYQGPYWEDGDAKGSVCIKPHICMAKGCTLSVETYSILGNNAYPFAEFTSPSGSYSVMMPDFASVDLIGEGRNAMHIGLSQEDIASVNMAKSDVCRFAECLMDIILKELSRIEASKGSPECGDKPH